MKKVLIITGISLLTFVIVVILLNSMSGESNKKKINDYLFCISLVFAYICDKILKTIKKQPI